MKTTITALTLCLGLTALSTQAHADADSIITVGLGTALGYANSTNAVTDTTSGAMSPELNVRLKFLYVLGAEFAYSPGVKNNDSSQLVFDNQFRLSALIYLVPTRYVGVYAKGGIGGDGLGDLFKVSAPSNAYHAGGGLEVYLMDHLAIGAEFLMLVPGVSSVETVVTQQALKDAQVAVENGGEFDSVVEKLGVGDFVSPKNFRASLAVRWYF